jgi:hypothetical protein
MTLESNISDLYNQGIVSGSTFLYCVENNIDTVDGLLAIADNIPDDVISDIIYMKSELNIPSSNPENNDLSDANAADNNVLQSTKIGYSESYSLYQELKYENDTRTINRLNYIDSTYIDKDEFIRYLLSVDFDSILKLPLVGRNTARQIVDLSRKLSEYLNGDAEYVVKQDEGESSPNVVATFCNAENLDALLPVIRSFADNYSVRSKNGVLSLITNCNDSVYQLVETLSASQFNPIKLRNIGKNSVPEIMDFRSRVLALCAECSSQDGIERLESINRIQLYAGFAIPNPDAIIQLEGNIGHFPLLAAVNQLINNLSEREKRIFKEYLLTIRGGIELDLDDMATELSLSRERVRQLATKQVGFIQQTVASWRELLGDYHYPIFEKDAWLAVCEAEGVSFTQNFVRWLISLVDSEVYLIGDPMSAFKTYHGRIKPLYLMPKRLYDIFDIHSFIEHINNLASEKRYKEERYNLRELIYNFFRGRVLFEIVEELEDFARRIIDYEVDCLLYEGDLIFRANAVKNAPEIIEDIIRANGDVMSLDEIYAKYKELHPLKEIEPKNIRASIHQNKNIKPLGRSGRYTLSEWKDGYARGGTIREFAYECIVNSPAKIVRIDALCEYISQFRKDVEEDSIQSNLLAEASGKFGLYFYDGERYIGLTSVQYDDCYIAAINDESSERRSTKQSYTLLENFIVEHKRFPFSSGPDDEPRLYRFWYNQTYCYTHGDIDAENKQIYDHINTKYGHYKVSQCDYIWHRTFIELRDLVKQQCFGEIKNRHNKWLLQNAELYKNKQLAEWQEPLFKELIQLIMLD